MSVMRRVVGWILWLALSVVLLLAVRAVAWSDVIAQLALVRVPWVVAALAANMAILPLWAAEWRLLLPRAFRVTYGRMFGIVAISAAVLNAVPFFAGEASAVALLIGRAGLSRSAALSVLALDQLLVAFAKLAVLAGAALMFDLPSWLRAGVLSLASGFAALFAALIILAHFWERVHASLRSMAGGGLISRMSAGIVRWGGHLEMLRDPRRAATAVALAILKKAAEIGAVVATQLAFGLEPSAPVAVLVVAALAVTTLLPVTPGNLGIYEATVYAIYRYAGTAPELAAGLALVQHACFLLPSLATGYAIATLAHVREARRAAPAG